jgi:hypothetical protein
MGVADFGPLPFEIEPRPGGFGPSSFSEETRDESIDLNLVFFGKLAMVDHQKAPLTTSWESGTIDFFYSVCRVS